MTKKKTPPPAPPMLHAVELVPIGKIKPYPKNAREHPEDQILALMKSIAVNGWTSPIQIDSKNVIIAGHGRLIAAQRLGNIKEIPCVRVLGQAGNVRALRIADNQIAARSTWNEGVRLEELVALNNAGVDMELSGFKLEELGDLRLLPGLAPLDGDKKGKTKGGGKQLSDGMEFRVVIDCVDEEHQAKLLDRFEKEGIKCRPLIS